MAVEVFLGNPPANIREWIERHIQPIVDPAKTRFTLLNGTVEEWNIIGTLNRQWLTNNGYYDRTYQYPWLKDIQNIEIGNTVTSIEEGAFEENWILKYMTIPSSVISIGESACNETGLITITVLGKTTSEAQALLANANVPEGCTIIGELG